MLWFWDLVKHRRPSTIDDYRTAFVDTSGPAGCHGHGASTVELPVAFKLQQEKIKSLTYLTINIMITVNRYALNGTYNDTIMKQI